MKLPLISLFLLLGLSCSQQELIVVDDVMPPTINQSLSYNDFLEQIGNEQLLRGVERPDDNGALGRNKEGYFHVRFQLGMSALSDFAISSNRIDALEAFITTLDYAFQFQLEDGSFLLDIPSALEDQLDVVEPSSGDLASGVAFFASSLGTSLLALDRSSWYLSATEALGIKERVRQLDGQFNLTLDYLLSEQQALLEYDRAAPNRLLFDALGYYTLGTFLDRQDAILVGKLFLSEALKLVDSKEGYFIEAGGFDSSYNGVACKLAIELMSFMEVSERSELETAINSAMNWQISRINPEGEISTEGNSRVFEGGESFLGTEKRVDYAKTVKALYYYSLLTGEEEIEQIANRVLTYYAS